MKLVDIVSEIPEERRKEVEKTIDACMTSICCEDVDWRNFNVYDSSSKMMQKILEHLSIEFLLPIAEKAKTENEREVIIFCSTTSEKEDEIWFVRVKSTELHATINLSSATAKYIKADNKE